MIGKRLLIALAMLPCYASAQTVAVKNARVVTMGPAAAIASGTVVVRDGKIVAVGANERIPADAKIIDAQGMFLTPGLVLTGSTVGVNDTVGPMPGGRSATGDVTAAFNATGDFNPNNPQVGEARLEGTTRAVITPNGQVPGKVFGGEGAIVDLGSAPDMVTRLHAAIVVDTGEGGAATVGGRDAVLEQVGEALDDALAFQRQPVRESGSKLTSRDLVALRRVAKGEEPLLIQVNRASDILNVLSFAHNERIKVILSGAAEGWMVADRIAAAGVPVLIDAEDNQPATFDKINATYENPALLRKAGVTIAFKPGIARTMLLVRTPRLNAGRAVRYGLSWHDALAAVTINPARMFGAADRFGSIEVGKDADLVLWSGDPLETTTVARMVMIRGVEQPLTARNRLLRDRYARPRAAE